MGIKRNFRRLLEAASGDYVAIVEGDDYWLSDRKLQIQCDSLSSDPDAVLSFAAVKKAVSICGLWRESRERILSEEEVERIPELLRTGWFGANTCTYVITAKFLKNHLSSRFFNIDLTSGDWPLLMHASVCGKIKYTPLPLAAYRVTPGSIMNSGIESRLHLLVQQVEWWNIYSSNGISEIDWKAVEERIIASGSQYGLRPDDCGDIILLNGKHYRASRVLYKKFQLRRMLGIWFRWLFKKSI